MEMLILSAFCRRIWFTLYPSHVHHCLTYACNPSSQSHRHTGDGRQRQTDRQTHIHTDRHTDRRIDKQTNRLTDRWADRHLGRECVCVVPLGLAIIFEFRMQRSTCFQKRVPMEMLIVYAI